MAGVLIGLAAAGLSAGVAYLLFMRDPEISATARATPSTTANSTSPSPTASPTSESPPAQVVEAFRSQNWAEGERVWLGVADLGRGDPGCVLHTYRSHGKVRSGYESNCSSWEDDGYDIVLFHVTLWNSTRRAIPFSVRDFALTARDGRTFGPVNVRAKAEFPPNFLPEKGKLLPRSKLVGYLTFDGRVTGMVAARISYVDGRQTISIDFEGKHTARR